MSICVQKYKDKHCFDLFEKKRTNLETLFKQNILFNNFMILLKFYTKTRQTNTKKNNFFKGNIKTQWAIKFLGLIRIIYVIKNH